MVKSVVDLTKSGPPVNLQRETPILCRKVKKKKSHQKRNKSLEIKFSSEKTSQEKSIVPK